MTIGEIKPSPLVIRSKVVLLGTRFLWETPAITWNEIPKMQLGNGLASRKMRCATRGLFLMFIVNSMTLVSSGYNTHFSVFCHF
jgi:hypothetical protein